MRLIRSADAGERLGRHRVDRLVLGNAQGILVADQGLGVQLERLAHQLGDSIRQLVTVQSYRGMITYPQTTTPSRMLPHTRATVELSLPKASMASSSNRLRTLL